MVRISERHLFCTVAVLAFCAVGLPLRDADALGQTVSTWKLGPPIVTYWNAGDKLTLTDEIARRAVAGGYNLVWVTDPSQLAIAQQYGLRTQLINQSFLTASSLDNPTKLAQLNALIDRYKASSAAYTYFVTDEPNAKAFADCARLVAHIRQRDPGHLAYINLLPFSCTAEELGTLGDTTAAYNAYLSQYVNTVRPSLLSYDHYQFLTTADSNGYLKNLAVVGAASRQAGVPFMNIVQACGWKSGLTFRVPTGNEMRYLVYTTLAYGAQGISYYYYDTGVTNSGGLVNPDGAPTAIYTAIAPLNREFVAIATELQPLRLLGVYHAGMTPPGTMPLASNAPFRLDPPVPSMPYKAPERVKGILLGLFGPAGKNHEPGKPTHVLVVNLDYKTNDSRTIVGPGKLEIFDVANGSWLAVAGSNAALQLPPGGGKLLRLQGSTAKKL
jgi:hypothetical protein